MVHRIDKRSRPCVSLEGQIRYAHLRGLRRWLLPLRQCEQVTVSTDVQRQPSPSGGRHPIPAAARQSAATAQLYRMRHVRLRERARDQLRHAWSLLTNPSVVAFDIQQIGASATNTVLIVLGAGIIIGLAYNLERPSGSAAPVAALWGIAGGPIAALGCFTLGAGVLQLLARLAGGSGSFRTYSYLLALALCPLAVIAAVGGGIPVLGSIVATGAGLYGFVLTVLASMSVHRLTAARAVATALASLLVMGVFLLVAIVLVALALVHAISLH